MELAEGEQSDGKDGMCGHYIQTMTQLLLSSFEKTRVSVAPYTITIINVQLNECFILF